jgi:serine/threonine protein kinase
LDISDDLEESRARDLGLKIGQAIEYLHDNGIVLRDIDTNGILMTEATSDMKAEGQVPRISRLS